MAKTHIRGLDTMRGIGSICVALGHARASIGLSGILPHDYLWVDLFFVLSGLVVYRGYGEALAGGLSTSRFLWNRFARLGPLYVLATVMGIGVFLLFTVVGHHPIPPAKLIGAAAFNIFALPCPPALSLRPDGALYPFLLPAWSVAWEMVLSVAFALWVKAGRPALGLIVAAGALALFASTFDLGRFDYGYSTFRPWIGGLRATLGFALGVLAARSLPDQAMSLGARRAWAAAGIASTLAALWYVVMQKTDNLWLDFACLTVLFPVLTFAISLFDPIWLRSRLGEFMGQLSYSCYLLHGLVIVMADAAAARLFPKESFSSHIAIALTVAFVTPALCWLIYEKFERPTQKALLKAWSDRIAPRLQARTAPARALAA